MTLPQGSLEPSFTPRDFKTAWSARRPNTIATMSKPPTKAYACSTSCCLRLAANCGVIGITFGAVNGILDKPAAGAPVAMAVARRGGPAPVAVAVARRGGPASVAGAVVRRGRSAAQPRATLTTLVAVPGRSLPGSTPGKGFVAAAQSMTNYVHIGRSTGGRTLALGSRRPSPPPAAVDRRRSVRQRRTLGPRSLHPALAPTPVRVRPS